MRKQQRIKLNFPALRPLRNWKIALLLFTGATLFWKYGTGVGVFYPNTDEPSGVLRLESARPEVERLAGTGMPPSTLVSSQPYTPPPAYQPPRIDYQPPVPTYQPPPPRPTYQPPVPTYQPYRPPMTYQPPVPSYRPPAVQPPVQSWRPPSTPTMPVTPRVPAPVMPMPRSR